MGKSFKKKGFGKKTMETMATKVLVLVSSIDGPEVVYCAAMDAVKLGAGTRGEQLESSVLASISRSTPSDRQKAVIPGCSIKHGHFVTNKDRDETGADTGAFGFHQEDLGPTFLDLVWEHVNEDKVREFTTAHHCIVITALCDE